LAQEPSLDKAIVDRCLVMRVALPLIAAAASIAAPRDFAGYSFEDYKVEFGKSYGAEEHESRRAVFEANLKLINEQNSRESKSWFAEVNEFASVPSAPVDGFVISVDSWHPRWSCLWVICRPRWIGGRRMAS